GDYREAVAIMDRALESFARCAQAETDGSGRFGMPALYQGGFILLRMEDYENAGNAFKTAADRYPGHKAHGECRFLEGEAALRAGKLPRAEKAYRKAVAAGGDFADDGLMGIAWCRRGSGDRDGALATFRDVARRFPGSELWPKALIEAARMLLAAKKPDEARRELQKVLRHDTLPREHAGQAWELMGLCFLELRRADEALDVFRKALAQSDEAEKKARIHFSIGEAFAEKEDWKASLAAYRQAEGLSGDPALLGDAAYGQCLALHRLARFKDSLNKARQLLERDPSHRLSTSAAFAVGENLFAMKDFRQADGAYARIEPGHELGPKAAFKRAWCSYLQGKFEVAARRFGKLASKKNASRKNAGISEESLSMEALSWLEAGKPELALQAADRYRARHSRGKFLARTERVAGRVLKTRGDMRGAAARFSRAASVEKSSDRAGKDHLEFADALFSQGDYAAAKRAYRGLTERNDQVGARASEGMAWCAYELGENEACLAWIRKGLSHSKAGSGRAGLFELLYALHHRSKSWSEAEKAARSFLAEFGKHPRAAEMRYSLGVAQARGGRLEEARRTLEALREVKGVSRPDRVHYELAWVCRKLKDEKAAQRAFAAVARTSKDEDLKGEANLQIGEALLDQRKVAEGRARLQSVNGKYKRRALYRIGFSWLEEKKHEKAFPYFDQVARLGPGSDLWLESVFLAGESLFMSGDQKRAAERFRLLVGKAPEHPRAQVARLHLGECEIGLGRPEEGAALLEEFLRREGDSSEPGVAKAHLWLGKARQSRGEFGRAEAAFKRATELSESAVAAEAQYQIGQCRLQRGALDDAVDAFVKLSILYAHEEWVQRGLLSAASCYVKLKQRGKARKFFKELIDRFPSSDVAREAKAGLKGLRRL
ncbi:MAG: tetratricopeptide repeat protein, partial [Planctomycetota bacterium]